MGSPSTIKEKDFICTVCEKDFPFQSDLDLHLQTCLKDSNYIMCNGCQEKFPVDKNNVHIYSPKSPYVCKDCHKKYVQKFLDAQTEKSFKCDICHKLFAYKCSLKLHLRTHLEKKLYKCLECLKEFNRVTSFKQHMLTHTPEKPFICNVCQRGFYAKRNLRLHLQTHSGEKPFSCYVCQKTFYQKRVLDEHLRTHTKEKPFVCNICQRAFSQSGSLYVHFRTHTGEKPFECDVCQKLFATRTGMTKHQQCMHPNKHGPNKEVGKSSCPFISRTRYVILPKTK